MTCRVAPDRRVAAALGELTEAQAARFEAHLADCDECTRELDALRDTLEIVTWELTLPPAERPDLYSAIATRLDAIDADRARPRRLPLRSWGRVAAAVTLVALGLGVGLRLRSDPEPIAVATTAHDDVAQLLERALPLVLEAANSQPLPTALTSGPGEEVRALATELAAEAQALAEALGDRGERRRGRLLSDLAEVLEQISALPREDPGPALRRARETLADRALLFQVSADQMRRL